ncbi:MAG: acyl-CoA dehydrogenase family protein [Minwuia sp.]|uniref:acyl-CoA dehydrogenase family protein n=1 Tax=Minwuia sp. TaxID=2493630 RepID=UPI003A861FB8
MNWTKDEERLLEVNRQVAEVAASVAADCEANRRPPREVWQAYADAGLKGMLVPKAKGGHALRASVMAAMSEELGRADPVAALTFVPQEYCMSAIATYGAHDWHDEILASLMAAEITTGFLLTEPGAGSDATAMATLATEMPFGWRLNGTKAWVTNAPYIDEYFVFAQTEPGAGAKGIAGFLVPRERDGVIVGEPYEMLGGYVASIADVTFADVILEPERMVVPPGEGLRAALSAIDMARINVGAECCGALSVGLETALDYTTQRNAFGQKLANFQGLQWQLAEVATDLYAARLMVYDAAAKLEAQGKASVEAAHAKKFATRAAMDGLDICMGQMGSNGLKHDTPLPRLFAAAKIAKTLDGATEIQNLVISRGLLAPYRDRL